MKSDSDIRKSFDEILSLREDIVSLLKNLAGKIEKLKKKYTLLLKTHQQSSSLFGIDSFYFQNTLLETEYDNMIGILNRIDNRFYCDYYTLNKLIHEYIKNEIKNSDLIKKTHISKTYPAYKNLEPTKTYPVETIIDLQSGILSSITELKNYLSLRENILINDTQESDLGINIDNLVLSQNYLNLLLRERIKMFSQNLEIFNKHHKKYFTRLYLKLKLMIGVVNEDISVKTSKGVKSKTSINPLENVNTKEQVSVEIPNSEGDTGFENHLINVDDVSPETRKAMTTALECISSESSVISDEILPVSEASNVKAEEHREDIILHDAIDNVRSLREKEETDVHKIELNVVEDREALVPHALPEEILENMQKSIVDSLSQSYNQGTQSISLTDVDKDVEE